MTAPDQLHLQSVAQVREWVEANFKDREELAAEDIKNSPVTGAAVGWRLPHEDGPLLLLLDDDFPYSEPRLVADGAPQASRGAHIEKSGKICLAGDGARIDALLPVRVVEHSYREAVRLLASNKLGSNDNDFSEDFNAYWRRDALDDKTLKSLIAPTGPSRIISTWSGKLRIVADDGTVLRRFIENMKYAREPDIQSGFAIWMDSLPKPIEYPTSVEGLRKLVRSRSKDGIEVLDKVLTSASLPIYGVLQGLTGGAQPVGVGGIRIAERSTAVNKVKDPLNKGFRPGKVPASVLAQRLDLKRFAVAAIDEAKTRRPSYVPNNLSSRTVFLIACGSLGSGIAKLLLQSGVGKVILVDPDVLSWANVERHELGALSVGQNKATALASEFRGRFPLAEIEAHAEGWRHVYRAKPELLCQADLIISTSADWNSDSALSDLQRAKALAGPVIYGWLEESALAAHAVALTNEGPCLRCAFTPTGEYLFPAVRAPGGMLGGCGGGISLYGAIDMAPGQAMIAGVALDVLVGMATAPLHRVWLCPGAILNSAEADWSPTWIAEHGAPPPGGTIVPSGWPSKGGCKCRT